MQGTKIRAADAGEEGHTKGEGTMGPQWTEMARDQNGPSLLRVVPQGVPAHKNSGGRGGPCGPGAKKKTLADVPTDVHLGTARVPSHRN